MRKGFLSFLILLLICAGIVFAAYYYINQAPKNPSVKVQSKADIIPKYPNATEWKYFPRKNLCIVPDSPCTEYGEIIFTSKDSWSNVYGFYRKNLIGNGWDTNNTILSQIPATIVFFSEDKCEANFTDPSKPKSQETNNDKKFTIKIYCKIT